MKIEQVRDLDSKELEQQLRELEDTMFHLRFQMRMGQMDGLKKYRGLKKDRAKMLTILQERKMAAEAEQADAAKKG